MKIPPCLNHSLSPLATFARQRRSHTTLPRKKKVRKRGEGPSVELSEARNFGSEDSPRDANKATKLYSVRTAKHAKFQ